MAQNRRKSASQPSLRFTEIRLENWRNFASTQVALQRRVFLVGPNASGKTNFLDVFRFLHDLVSVGGGFQESVRKRRGVSSLRCLAARRYSDVAVTVTIGNDDTPAMWRYELRFNQDKQRRPIIKKELVTRQEKEILHRPEEKDRGDPERLTQTFLEQVHANQSFREVADFLSSTSYLHIVPQLVREPDRFVGKANDPFGGDFVEQIARKQEKTRNIWLKRIREALQIAVPQLVDLELWRDTRGTPHLRARYEHWRPQGAWQTEEEFSDGTLRLIGLLWSALAGNGPLLLQEPELSLYAKVISCIPQMFARLQRRTGRQVMISTHSRDLLQDEGIGLEELLLLEPQAEGTSIGTALDSGEIRALVDGGLPLAEAVIPKTSPNRPHQLTLFKD